MNHLRRKIKTAWSLMAGLVIITGFSMGVNTPAMASQKAVLAFGDSLTSGYGIAVDEAWPARLEKMLRARGHDVRLINAGVAGDTTSAGRGRLAWTLEQNPGVMAVIVALGANDMLRAVDPAVTRDNLESMLILLRDKKIPVLLAGMRAAPNLGGGFAARYDRIGPDLAKAYDVVYLPFLLEGVAADPALNQADGLHPNEKGADKVAENILPYVEALIARRTRAEEK